MSFNDEASEVCTRRLGIKNPSLDDMNSVIAMRLAHALSPLSLQKVSITITTTIITNDTEIVIPSSLAFIGSHVGPR